MDLLPFLNKGSEGIKELEKQSDKLGNTLSGKDLAAVKENTKAKREWHATIQGLQIQLGRYLFPILTRGAQTLAQVSGFVERNGAVMKPLIGIVAGLAAGIFVVNKAHAAWRATTAAWSAVTKVATAVQAAFNFVMDANPIMLVVIGIAALAAGLIFAYKKSDTFRHIVQGAFHAVGAAFSFVWDKLKAGFGWVRDHWKLVLSLLTGPIGAAVIFIATHWDAIVSGAKTLMKRIGAVFRSVTNLVTAPFRLAFNAIADLWNGTVGRLSFKVPGWVPGIGGDGFSMPHIPKLARGADIMRAGAVTVGDNGPEQLWLPTGARVAPLPPSARRNSAGGGAAEVLQPIVLQIDGREIQRVLLRVQRTTGQPLGFR
jgi:phage-related protein